MSRTIFVWRILSIGLVLLLAALAVRQSIASIAATSAPGFSPAFVADDPRLIAKNVDLMLSDPNIKMDPKRLLALSRQSVTGQPLNPKALRQLAIASDMAQSGRTDLTSMNLSRKVSRRDLGTNIWFVEHAAARNDVPGALKSYDLALQTNTESPALLFPILTQAMAEPQVILGLAKYVRSGSTWVEPFLGYAITKSDDPASLVRLAVAANGFGKSDTRGVMTAGLINRLIEKQLYVEAQRLYQMIPDVPLDGLVSTSLSSKTIDPKVGGFAWQALPTSGLDPRISLDSGAGQGQFAVTAGSGERGVAFQKLLMLRPGTYRFSARVTQEAGGASSDLSIDFTCAAGQRRLSPPAASRLENSKLAVQSFTVGADCPAQYVTINVAGGDDQLGARYSVQNPVLGLAAAQ